MQTWVAPHIPHQESPLMSFSSKVMNSVNFEDIVNIDLIEEMSKKGRSYDMEWPRAFQTINRLI